MKKVKLLIFTSLLIFSVYALFLPISAKVSADPKQTSFKPGIYEYCLEQSIDGCLSHRETAVDTSLVFYDNFTGYFVDGNHGANFKWQLKNDTVIITKYFHYSFNDIDKIKILNDKFILTLGKYENLYYRVSDIINNNNQRFYYGTFQEKFTPNDDSRLYLELNNYGSGSFGADTDTGGEGYPLTWSSHGNIIKFQLTPTFYDDKIYTVEIIDFETLLYENTMLYLKK
jgi:hypothetical protein